MITSVGTKVGGAEGGCVYRRGQGWQDIAPDKHNDWIGQRSDVFSQFYPMGSKEARQERQMIRYLGCIH